MHALLALFLVGLLFHGYVKSNAPSNQPTFQELYEFLNTGRPIWTVLSSAYLGARNQQLMCLNITKLSLKDDQYNYTYCYRNGSDTHCEEENALLKNDTKYPQIVVKGKTDKKGVTYRATYFHTNLWCVILRFTQNGIMLADVLRYLHVNPGRHEAAKLLL
uniref:Lipocalin n=1 Tax=Rhipicephalus zambeziensis TaxID=60191 RepID=A0A224YCJ4_9ACAR